MTFPDRMLAEIPPVRLPPHFSGTDRTANQREPTRTQAPTHRREGGNARGPDSKAPTGRKEIFPGIALGSTTKKRSSPVRAKHSHGRASGFGKFDCGEEARCNLAMCDRRRGEDSPAEVCR